MMEGRVPETLEEDEGRDHRYYFKDAPEKCSQVEVDQIAKIVIDELERVFDQLEHEFQNGG